MACTVNKFDTVEVSLQTQGQTREKIVAMVETMLRQAGVVECGIMGGFFMRFGEDVKVQAGPDLAADLRNLGVVSVKTTQAH
jgi:hypothetical protein